ncbi:DUF2270 domain-containing protein [Oricola sp.]|uniref:DUF2270 domain-containing protein n=1 Tax=Oricola sp. TaxID=1979950 RepID=UPI003BABE26E
MDQGGDATTRRSFDSSEMGALAHLYRGEIYRSTIWRTRLDTTTNWAVVTLGIALSISFSSPNASPLPLVLVGVLILFFLWLEARRYRYFNVWRARARWLENNFYAPMLKDGDLDLGNGWPNTLAEDYLHPAYHIDLWTALGRRIRRNYLWILLIQWVAYLGKLIVHPTAITSTAEIVERADIGPLPGEFVLGTGVVYIASWAAIAIWIGRRDTRKFRSRQPSPTSMG